MFPTDIALAAAQIPHQAGRISRMAAEQLVAQALKTPRQEAIAILTNAKHTDIVDTLNGSVFDAKYEALQPSVIKAIGLLQQGLFIDGGHHKQWFLEEALKALGVDLAVMEAEVLAASKSEMAEDEAEDYTDEELTWEKGIAP